MAGRRLPGGRRGGLAALAMAALLGATFLAATTTGIGVWRSAVPSRPIGIAVTVAGLLFLAPMALSVTTVDVPEAAIVALFATWLALLDGVGMWRH